jgi:hypothetical protein
MLRRIRSPEGVVSTVTIQVVPPGSEPASGPPVMARVRPDLRCLAGTEHRQRGAALAQGVEGAAVGKGAGEGDDHHDDEDEEEGGASLGRPLGDV